jgi:hypothetical protein
LITATSHVLEARRDHLKHVLRKACVGRRVAYFSVYQASTSDWVQVRNSVSRPASQARKAMAWLIRCRDSFIVVVHPSRNAPPTELLHFQEQHMSTTSARETVDVKAARDAALAQEQAQQRAAQNRAQQQRETAARDGGWRK